MREVYLSEYMPFEEKYSIPVFTTQDTLMIKISPQSDNPGNSPIKKKTGCLDNSDAITIQVSLSQIPLLVEEETVYYVQIGSSQLELIMKVVMEDHMEIMTKSVLMSPRKGTDMMS